MTFVFTAYPGILIHAGLLHDFAYPRCGCDAYDATWPFEADGLERQVFATVRGDYRETVARGLRPWIGYSMTDADGSSAGQAPARDLPAQRLAGVTQKRDQPRSKPRLIP